VVILSGIEHVWFNTMVVLLKRELGGIEIILR